MRNECMICWMPLPSHADDPEPGEGPITSSYCTSCGAWHRTFSRSQMAGDPTATTEEFNRMIELFRSQRANNGRTFYPERREVVEKISICPSLVRYVVKVGVLR